MNTTANADIRIPGLKIHISLLHNSVLLFKEAAGKVKYVVKLHPKPNTLAHQYSTDKANSNTGPEHAHTDRKYSSRQ